MTEKRKPNLSLPEAPPSRHRPKGSGLGIVAIILLIVVIFLQVYPLNKKTKDKTSGQPVSTKQWKELALKLTQRNLHKAAAQAWRKYLAGITDDKERGKILYQIGNELMLSEDYEEAVSAFFRADKLISASNNLTQSLTEKISTCFERLGRYSEKDRELRERVLANSDKNKASQIAAEIGLEKIPLYQVDRMISREIELQIKWQLAVPDQVEKKLLKQYLDQFSNPQKKLQKIYQMIGQQLLYRRGRELKIDIDPEFRELMSQIKIQLVAQAVVAHELKDKINPTESDLRTYFAANSKQFQLPPKATARLLPVNSKEEAKKLLGGIKTESDFLNAAKKSGIDKSILAENISPGDPIGTLGNKPELSKAIFKSGQKGLLKNPVESNGSFMIIYITSFTPSQIPTFETVKNEVVNKYYTEKQKELKQSLIMELFSKYGAMVHDDVILGTGTPSTTKTGEKNKTGETKHK